MVFASVVSDSGKSKSELNNVVIAVLLKQSFLIFLNLLFSYIFKHANFPVINPPFDMSRIFI